MQREEVRPEAAGVGSGATAWRASFPMYDFPWLAEAHEALWAEIAAGLVRRGWQDVPVSLHHQADVHTLWHEHELLISQSCGWPLVDELAGKVVTIGAFEYDVASADGPTYHGQLLMRAGSSRPSADALPTVTAAVNSFASLSGWVSLVHAFPELSGVWPGRLLETGSHEGSMAALQRGEVDLAMIDAVSLAQFRAGRPESLAGLIVVGEGPRIPCLPIIGPLAFTDVQIAGIRAAITEALASDRGREAAKPLLIKRFHARDFDDYRPVQALAIRAG